MTPAGNAPFRFPATARERTEWILHHRPDRNVIPSDRAHAVLVEPERAGDGRVVDVATVFLSNRECPWRCLMCDLWRNTLEKSVSPGAIVHQIDQALDELRHRTDGASPAQIKLYNSGSFFDVRAIPPGDHAGIAERLKGFERVIVECHPALVGEPVVRFRDQLQPDTKLEVAMGLETVHPDVLEKLNKGMTLEDFARAADLLREQDIAMRAFVLVKPPFILEENEALHWAERSIVFAQDCGATVVALIPTRPGNGAMDELLRRGLFAPPRLSTLEQASRFGVGRGRGRVFADLWDLEQFSQCTRCFPGRRSRLHRMNLEQCDLPPVSCESCDET